MVGAIGRVDRWLDHCAEVGTALMQPSRAFPGFVIGYTVWQGKLKHYCSIGSPLWLTGLMRRGMQ